MISQKNMMGIIATEALESEYVHRKTKHACHSDTLKLAKALVEFNKLAAIETCADMFPSEYQDSVEIVLDGIEKAKDIIRKEDADRC